MRTASGGSRQGACEGAMRGIVPRAQRSPRAAGSRLRLPCPVCWRGCDAASGRDMAILMGQDQCRLV